MSRINSTIDSHRCHHIPASSTSANHLIHWEAATGKVKISVERSEQWQRIACLFLSAPRMTGTPRWKQPPMKCWWEQCGYSVNSLFLLGNKISRLYLLKTKPMHSSDFTRRRVLFENRKCHSLLRPKSMTCWQRNPISSENKTFIRFVLQWRPLCIGLKWFPQ